MPLPSGIMQPNSGGSRHLQTLASASSTKGNDGRGSRKRVLCRITIWVGVLLAVYQILWSYWLAGLNIPDVEIDKVTGQKRIRRRPHLLRKHDHVAHQDVPTYVPCLA